ncbi:MAG: hypothetical protein HYR91_03695 [Flavobacteriia bacterium]|nr:hypothetical protein [Flavobacteriia bacterium]
MKNIQSFIALIIIAISFLSLRFSTINSNSSQKIVTTWDAFGYYMYLPSEFIYKDVKNLNWISKIDSNYHVTGGNLYQAISIQKSKNTFTNRYLTGVAIMQSPFFFIGHQLAKLFHEPLDGFSWPYQFSIMFAAISWAVLGFYFLRKVLLKFFNDQVAALTLILIALASNLIQYVAIDSGMSHAYIFPLYAIVLWLTIIWHETPKMWIAFLLGFIIGLCVISRPTELIIIFIPLFWDTSDKIAKKMKWQMVQKNKLHLCLCVAGGIIALLPQFAYWKYTTGQFVFDVGSKWYFLNPWFRVLIGPEKGWFLYTPIALLMIFGMFKLKGTKFKKSVLTFCLLNIWIVISWSDWRYGASYSTRALTHSYPVFALPLACIIQYIMSFKKNIIIYSVALCFIFLNFYQIRIYNQGTIENFSPFLLK